MRFDEVQLPSELLSFLKSKGLSDLYPPQEEAIKAGLLEGKNLVISSPTASGKTLIALIAAYLKVKRERRRVVYLAPLRALASEKYSEFREMESLGIRTAISTGDYDSSGESLGRGDIIVLTNERFDSVMRHRVSWLDSVGLFIADEVHLAGSDSRGPTLEMILTKVMHLGLDSQLLSLSATISNAGEVSRWLNSKLVELNWRPVPLREGVYDYGRILFTDGEERPVTRSTYGAPIDVGIDTVKMGGQSLIFAGTRRRAVSLATKAAEITTRYLGEREKDLCGEAARRIRSAGEGTSLSNLLADLVSKGSAFHHAGLESEHRRIVEDYYRLRAIKLLASTPTLASGVNIPARRVVIADLTRFDVEQGGSTQIPVLEYRQMAGRAGRPQYDEYGETVIVPPPTQPAAELLQHYAKDPSEPIRSTLADEGAMRAHVLATVATSTGLSRVDVEGLFARTLLAAQVGRGEVMGHIDEAFGYLLSEKLLESNGNLFYATEFGKRVSILYIDPATGVLFRNALKTMEAGKEHTVGLLHVIARSPDFEPRFPLRNRDLDQAIAFLEEHSGEMVLKPHSKSYAEYDETLQDMRSVMTLYAWIDEMREEQILSRLGVEPGDLHRAVDNSDWLIYSLGELAKLFKKAGLNSEIDVLRRRVEGGVGKELIELTALQGVGRVRARSLHTAGYRSIEDIQEAPADKLALVEKIGTALARKLKEQVSRY